MLRDDFRCAFWRWPSQLLSLPLRRFLHPDIQAWSREEGRQGRVIASLVEGDLLLPVPLLTRPPICTTLSNTKHPLDS
jgi:hypothetical protein